MRRKGTDPIVEQDIQRGSQKANDDFEVARRFESPASALTGLSLVFGAAFGLLYLMQLDPANSLQESSQSLLWSLVLGVQMGVVLAPHSPFGPRLRRLITYLNCVLLVALPHLPVCRRGSGAVTGAAQGAASILVCCRAFQLLHRIEKLDTTWSTMNGRWRRFYTGCALSWHDVDVSCTQLAPAHHRTQLLQDLLLYVVLLIAPCYTISILPPPLSTFSAWMGVRCLAMSGAMIAAFNVFDMLYSLILCTVHGVAVKSIMAGHFWESRTVKDIWKGWNLPYVSKLSFSLSCVVVLLFCAAPGVDA